MLSLANYQELELIFDEGKTSIYRARREYDSSLVVIKVLSTEYPSLQDIARIKHEYEILKNLNIAGVVKAYNLEKYNNHFALILENIDGVSLKEIIKTQKIELHDFLQIAVDISQSLGELHQQQIIHKDIKPPNILINWSERLIKIIDFSISSRLSKENPQLDNSNLLEGTLAYISPEQTGRMNRSLDYRTDLYSLGVTFYEMLTGRLPFNVTNPMELVHCHIAKQPAPISELKPDIPPVISAIVMKLLSKNAEQRYQSAFGLKADLEKCLHQLESTTYIADFKIGQQDKSGLLYIPEKLYGRAEEINTLLTAFAQVSQGSKELILVTGYSGIGKSALVNELHKPIVQKRGYFISGKFEQFKRNIPYASLIQAFQGLVKQLFMQSTNRLAMWRKRLLNALGPNAQIIIDVIPEIELIIGKQIKVPELDSLESQNRFNLVFLKFIRVFAQKVHPLVIFLDDLQWADLASLKIIQLLATDSETANLLIIGAYRDNEVDAGHQLTLALQEIEKTNIIIKRINCQPLKLNDLEELISDTLKSTIEEIRPLAELILNKTAGNPFFYTQALRYIYQEKLLTYNFNTGQWEWDIEQIHRIGITDNVIDLMIDKIQKLHINTQNILQLAACIGNRFDLGTLAIINEKSSRETADELWEAILTGLVLPLDETYKLPQLIEDIYDLVIDYKFLHDRVQQAAYTLIPNAHKKQVHLRIGQLLLKNLDHSLLEEKIFDIVNQFNIGAELISNQAERNTLAELNLMAGMKAKDSTAYESSLKFFRLGLAVLAEDSWETHYQLTLDLHVETVELEYINTHFEQAEYLFESVIENSQNILHSVKVYEKKITFYISNLRVKEALDIVLLVLEKLGVTLSQSPPTELKIESLVNLPIMTDANKIAAMRILMLSTAAAAFADPPLLLMISFTMVNLCLQYGNSSLSAYAYATYSRYLCGRAQDIESGYQLGQLSLKLLEQFNAQELKAKIYFIYNCFVRPWKEHIKETIEPLRETLKIGLETGDTEYAGYSGIFAILNDFSTGENLEVLSERQVQYLELAQSIKQDHFIYYMLILKQTILDLVQGVKDESSYLEGEICNRSIIQNFTNNTTGIFLVYLNKLILCYFSGNYIQAIKNVQLAKPYALSASGSIRALQYNFYHSLALLARHIHQNSKSILSTEDELAVTLEQVEINQQQLQKWAFYAPINNQHKYELIEAEKARLLGQPLLAMEYYDRAISSANDSGYIHEEALANERAAEFYLSLGRSKIAALYMTKAHYCYICWGAKAKVKQLESKYSKLITKSSTFNQTESHTVSITSSSTTLTSQLDLITVIKASQTLSEEIILDNLLQKLMGIVIENAGAEIGYLILEREGSLFIKVRKTVGKNELMSQQIDENNAQEYLPISLIRYVNKIREDLVIDNATATGNFISDPYIIKNKVKSILCIPIIHQGKQLAILYLENSLIVGAFTADRLQILKLLSSQVAISLENAYLYANLEEKVAIRTQELNENNQQLQRTLHELKVTQTQLIQTEKMSSLGQMVAGIAHEINNPVTFIHGNIRYIGDYTSDLLNLVSLYQEVYPNTISKISSFIEDISLDYIKEDIPKIISSIKNGTERIREIVLTLRNFSRLDEADIKPVDIHKGIDSTLLILQSRLQSKLGYPPIEIIKNYGDLPLVECYAGQLNQVFMNVLSNAIDAIERFNRDTMKNGVLSNKHSSTITISTQIVNSDTVSISIKDNGQGIDAEVKQKIFDPFFTTKPVGEGTGLGLSISYQIVVNKHNGKIECISVPGKGAEFVIQIPLLQKVNHNPL